MSFLPSRRAPSRRGLRLWPVERVLALAFTGALLIAATVFAVAWNLLDVQGLQRERRLPSKTLFDLVKLSFGVVAGAGALVALVVAYRRQRVDEEAALREATRLHTERFTTAVTQLGHESPAVRLGGIHALAGLADDAPTTNLRQTCIDVICAYLRLPYTAETALPAGDTTARHDYLALRQVRHTVIRLIRDHLRLDPAEDSRSWRGHDLDFTDVVFDGGDFNEAVFTAEPGTGLTGNVDFTRARFADGWVAFLDAEFSGGTVSFLHTQFCGGEVGFTAARFSGGDVVFAGAEFSGSPVTFVGAKFSGGTVTFSHAEFSGGTVSFPNARFSGGTIAFVHTQFSGGMVSFPDAHFCGSTIDITRAHFHGTTIDFAGASGNRPPGLSFTSGVPAGLTLAPTWATNP